MPTEEQIARLLDFIDRPPSAPPPVFVGRKDIIHDIEKAAASVFASENSETHGLQKVTRVIHGAPGAGKSSILAQLDRRAVARRNSNPRIHNVLILNSEMLDDMGYVMRRILAAACLSSRRHRNAVLGVAAKAGASAAQSVTEIAGIREVVDFFVQRFGETPKTLPVLAENITGKDWTSPLVIAIDEAQNLPPDRHCPQAKFIQALHNAGHELPILPVLSGLGDTRDVVQAAGLSRPEFNREVGCFTPEERGEYLQKLQVRFGLLSWEDSATVQENLHKLMDDTEGWPRHMHHAFQALGDCARLTDGDLSRVDWGTVHKDSSDRRQAYYRSQQSPFMRSSVCLTGAVLDGLADGMKMAGVNSLIRRSVRDGDDWRLPEGMTVDGFRRHLVHKGALQERLDGTFHSPIPCFRRFLTDEANRPRKALPPKHPAITVTDTNRPVETARGNRNR